MEPQDWAAAGIDTERPSAARIYDYYLGVLRGVGRKR